MASQAPTRTREEERRLSVRTLVIASVASATAAIVTSRFSTAGTPIAAALTPVIVALVSELLHRPTEKIAERVTADKPAILPDAVGAGAPPAPDADPLPGPAPADPGSEPAPEPAPVGTATGHAGRRDGGEAGAPVRVYRGGTARRRVALGVVVATAALAFVIAAVALTIPELVTGQSVGKPDRNTTLFGGGAADRNENEVPTRTAPEDSTEKQDQRQEQEQRNQQTSEEQPQDRPRAKGVPPTSTGQEGGAQPPPGGQTTPAPAPQQPQP